VIPKELILNEIMRLEKLGKTVRNFGEIEGFCAKCGLKYSLHVCPDCRTEIIFCDIEVLTKGNWRHKRRIFNKTRNRFEGQWQSINSFEKTMNKYGFVGSATFRVPKDAIVSTEK
jgi:hypothetical protein